MSAIHELINEGRGAIARLFNTVDNLRCVVGLVVGEDKVGGEERNVESPSGGGYIHTAKQMLQDNNDALKELDYLTGLLVDVFIEKSMPEPPVPLRSNFDTHPSRHVDPANMKLREVDDGR